MKLWAEKNKMELNANKTKDTWSSFKKHSDNPSHLCINDMVIDRETEFKLQGTCCNPGQPQMELTHPKCTQESLQMYLSY